MRSRISKLLGGALFVLLSAARLDAAITFVQGKGNDSTTTSVTVTLTSNITAGNFLVAFTRKDSTGTDPGNGSMSDCGGNSWPASPDVTAYLTGEHRTHIWSVKATTGACNTVTYTNTSASVRMVVIVAEVSGMTTPTLDKTSSNTNAGPTSTITSNATATTTDANEFLMGGAGDTFNGTPYTYGSSFTKIDEPTGGPPASGRSGAGYRIVSATGAYSFDATTNNNNTIGYSSEIATYKDTGGGGGGCVPTMTLLGVGRCGD